MSLSVVETRRFLGSIPNPSGVLSPVWAVTDLQGAGITIVLQSKESKRAQLRVEEYDGSSWTALASGIATNGGLAVIGPFTHQGDKIQFVGVDLDGSVPEIEFVVMQPLPGGRGRKLA